MTELVRGQSEADYRPNKALSYEILLVGYKPVVLDVRCAKQHCTSMPRQAPRQSRLPQNYKAARRHLNSAFKSIRHGQDSGQFLVLDNDMLSLCDPVQIRPFGTVQKENVLADIEVLVIHDLSYHNGSANNNLSLHGRLPSIEYRKMAAVARRIEGYHCRCTSTTICILKGALCT